MSPVLTQTELLKLPLYSQGKVRDIYGLGDHLLFLASDRISAFDYILATGIPDKGKVLTQLSLFWFDFLRDIVPNHVVTADAGRYPKSIQPYADQLRGRSMIIRRAKMFPVECVVRGYISGSGWKEYREKQSICGIRLPAGLRESDKLPEPIFTPATKSLSGHDENISFAEMSKLVAPEKAARLRDLSLRIYRKASEYALTRGIIIADTKFALLAGGELQAGRRTAFIR